MGLVMKRIKTSWSDLDEQGVDACDADEEEEKMEKLVASFFSAAKLDEQQPGSSLFKELDEQERAKKAKRLRSRKRANKVAQTAELAAEHPIVPLDDYDD